MKKLINLILIATLLLGYSCTKQESVAYFTGGTAPTLTGTTNSGGTTINLSAADSTKSAIILSWTNPNYTFTYGVSTLNVGYLVEIDTTGSNFTNPNRAQIGVSQLTSLTLTEAAINSYLSNQMSLDTSFSHNIQIRVSAYMVTSGSGADTLRSSVLSFKAKPYFPPPVVTPPSTGTLFIVGGDPLLGSWSNSVPSSQQFTKVSTTEYYVIVTLSGGDPTQSSDQFSVTSQNGTWNGQYGVPSANLTSTYSGAGTFNANGVNGSGTNFPGPVAAGKYKIDLNFQTGKYTVVKQ